MSLSDFTGVVTVEELSKWSAPLRAIAVCSDPGPGRLRVVQDGTSAGRVVRRTVGYLRTQPELDLLTGKALLHAADTILHEQRAGLMARQGLLNA